MKTKISKTLRLAYTAILSSISILFMLILRFPIIPTASFLMFDICEVPILIASFFLGNIEAILMLIVVSLIESLCFSPFGIIGTIIHFLVSFILIILVCLFKSFQKSFFNSLMKLIFILIILLILVLPINYLLLKYIYMLPKDVILNLLLTAVLPFNLIKISANYVIALIVINLLKNKIKL